MGKLYTQKINKKAISFFNVIMYHEKYHEDHDTVRSLTTGYRHQIKGRQMVRHQLACWF